MHIVAAIEGELRFRTGTRWQQAPGVITPPDLAHEIDACDRDVLLVFVDPESRHGSILADVLAGEVRVLDASARDVVVRDATPDALMREGAERWLARVVLALGVPPPSAPKALHPRVRRVLTLLGAHEGPTPSLAALASAVGLSPSRLMHAFTESVGIPLRPYVAWLRLQRAAASIVAGAPLAQAAAQAGYSDAAHMTRSFRAMLGMTPSSLRPMV